MSPIEVRYAGHEEADDWAALRALLWPHVSIDDHRSEIDACLTSPEKISAFIAYSDSNHAIGFAEVSVRHDYVNGCDTSPVAFLEGIFVRENQRSRGVARQLFARVVDWGKARNLSELASDADIANLVSHQMHKALGFEETERVVYFRQKLR